MLCVCMLCVCTLSRLAHVHTFGNGLHALGEEPTGQVMCFLTRGLAGRKLSVSPRQGWLAAVMVTASCRTVTHGGFDSLTSLFT